MPTPSVDISFASTPNTALHISAEASPLFLSTVNGDMGADKCPLFLDLKASYISRQFAGEVEGPSSHYEQLPFKERESPQTRGLDLTQQQLCEIPQAVSTG